MFKNIFLQWGLFLKTTQPLSASLIIISELFFNTSKSFHSALEKLIWKVCYCRKFINLSTQVFLFWGGWKELFALTSEVSTQFSISWSSEEHISISLNFLVNSSACRFFSIIFRNGVRVYFRPLILRERIARLIKYCWR